MARADEVKEVVVANRSCIWMIDGTAAREARKLWSLRNVVVAVSATCMTQRWCNLRSRLEEGERR